MTIYETIVKQGDYLFRWRAYLPLVFIILFISAFFSWDSSLNLLQSYELYWELICFPVSIFGLIIRCFTVGFIPGGTSGRTKNQRADTLNKTGIYSIVRNPLYFANFFIILGLTLYTAIWWVVCIYILIFCLFYERIIFKEESFLIHKFGSEYKKYADKTPAFIPNLKLWENPALCFSFKTVLKKEHSGLLNIILAFTAMDIVSNYIVLNIVRVDILWSILLVFGVSFYILMLILKKMNLLTIEGR